MAAARLLHYILFTAMNVNCVYLCQFFSDKHETLATAIASLFFFFILIPQSECPEVSKFSCVQRAEMKGFLIDSYRISLLSQGTLRKQIRHRCLQNVTSKGRQMDIF